MAIKGKYRVSKRHRKSSCNNSRKRARRGKTHNKCRFRGGNYEKNMTTQTYLGFPMKQSNKVVTSVPGRGTMSVSAYKKLMETDERNGFDY